MSPCSYWRVGVKGKTRSVYLRNPDGNLIEPASYRNNELKEERNMASAERELIVEKVKEVIAAPSCCQELKDVAKKYLDSLDTADEKAAGRLLIAELEEDVQSLDDTMEFLSSDAAVEILGAEAVASMVETAKKVKAAGGKICFCPACTAGQAILDKKEVLL